MLYLIMNGVDIIDDSAIKKTREDEGKRITMNNNEFIFKFIS